MSERQLGSLINVSIGTAIPLETLFTLERSRKEDHLFMNIRTLFRNFIGSFEIDPYEVSPKKLTNVFIEELEIIQSEMSVKAVGTLQLVFYLVSAKTLAKQMPHAKIKTARTNKQKRYQELEEFVLSRLLKRSPWDEQIQIFDSLVKGMNTRALMITHYPLDLLSKHRFRTLTLLESHTGAFKTQSKWTSKVTTNDDYQSLPFNVLLIQLLGDGGSQFLSSGQRLIKPVIELAKKNHWTIATTNEKMKFDIRKMKDKAIASELMEMMQVKLR